MEHEHMSPSDVVVVQSIKNRAVLSWHSHPHGSDVTPASCAACTFSHLSQVIILLV